LDGEKYERLKMFDLHLLIFSESNWDWNRRGTSAYHTSDVMRQDVPVKTPWYCRPRRYWYIRNETLL